MALEEVLLSKEYKDGKVLFEKMLDTWRLQSQEGFANLNLNLTQLARDTFSAGYTYDNDGAANKQVSLEDRINAFEQGGADINGTASDSFTINSDGNGATLSTSGLTNTHTYTFPDLDGEFLTTTGVQTVTGAKSFSSQSLKIKGAGAGSITLDYANDADSRTYTFQDAGAAANIILSESSQNFNGTIQASNTSVALDLMADGNRIDLDTDNDTSIRCSADDTIKIEIGGVDKITINSSGELVLPILDPPTLLTNGLNSNSGVFARLQYDDATSVISYDYNIDSVGDNDGDGIYIVVYDTSSLILGVSGTVPLNSSAFFSQINSVTQNQAAIKFHNSAGAATDTSFHFWNLGR